MTIDRQKMINALMLKTGVKYDFNDPVFAIMEMNQLLIDECVAHEKKIMFNQISEEIKITLNKNNDKIFYLFIIAIFFACALGMAIGKFIL